MTIRYLHLLPGAEPLPLDEFQPFRAVLVSEQAVPDHWRGRVSDWLVRSGCLYTMAWGAECGPWELSVDWANLSLFDFGNIPDDRFVMTTCHPDEPLAEVFWFAGFAAHHPTVALELLVIIDIGATNRQDDMLRAYHSAQTLSD